MFSFFDRSCCIYLSCCCTFPQKETKSWLHWFHCKVRNLVSFHAMLVVKINTGCLKKKYLILTRNRNETIRYHYSPSGQLNLSIFNLDPHTLHLKIGQQTLEIQAFKVKIYSARETRSFVKGPSHDLLSQACCTGILTLTFSFLH